MADGIYEGNAKHYYGSMVQRDLFGEFGGGPSGDSFGGLLLPLGRPSTHHSPGGEFSQEVSKEQTDRGHVLENGGAGNQALGKAEAAAEASSFSDPMVGAEAGRRSSKRPLSGGHGHLGPVGGLSICSASALGITVRDRFAATCVHA